MAYSRRYSRIFVTLKQERPDYCLNFRPAMGRCIIEIRNNKGKILVYAQGLKSKVLYKVYMVTCEKDCSLAVPVELIEIDGSGKGEVKCEFDPDNVFGTGYPIENFKVVIIMVQGQNDIVVPMAGYIDNLVIWKNNFKYFSLDNNDKDSFGSEQAIKENVTNDDNKEQVLDDKSQKLSSDEDKSEEKEETTLNQENQSENIESIENKEDIADNTNDETDINFEQTDKEKSDINVENENTEAQNTDELDLPVNGDKQASLIESENIPKLDNMSDLGCDTSMDSETIHQEDDTMNFTSEQIKQEQDLESELLQDSKEELDMEKEQYKIHEQLEEIEKDEVKQESSDVKLAQEKEQKDISNTSQESKKANDTDSEIDLQNKVATSQDFYDENEDIEIKSTNEKIQEEKELNDSFKSMIGKFKKEFDELKYYTFMTEEDSKKKKEQFNFNCDNNIKFNDLEYMFENNQRMVPFEHQDKDIIWIRINIKELSVSPSNLWKYINNPFINCSYRKYKHLLLGKYQVDKKDCYIFAVPGVYSSDYRLEASMQGFNRFKCCENKNLSENDYGYWLLDII